MTAADSSRNMKEQQLNDDDEDYWLCGCKEMKGKTAAKKVTIANWIRSHRNSNITETVT